MSTTAPKPATTPIPVQLSEPEFTAFILPHLTAGRDRNTARATLGRSLAVSAFPRYVPV